MPLVKPFPGLLYADTRPESLARVLAPPFDMIGPEDQERLFAESPHNLAWLTVARWGQDPGYRAAAERLASWRREGVLAADPQPAFYVYEQTTQAPSWWLYSRPYPPRLRGFLAAVRLEDAQGPGIYPHENTFEAPIRDRVELIRATGCHLEPVFGVYTDDGGRVDLLLQEAAAQPPLREARMADGTVHRLFRLTDPPQQRELQQVLADRPAVIADGHHRFAGARAYRDECRALGGAGPEAPCEYTLMLLADTETSGLAVGAFHRLVQRLPEGVDPARLPELLAPDFSVTELPPPPASDEDAVRALLDRLAEEGRSGPAFACCCGSRTALVTPANCPALLSAAVPHLNPDIEPFDVALLHRLLLKPRLGCTGEFGPEARNVLFEHNPLLAWRAARSGAVAMAWFVNPADLRQVTRIALAGHRVPQKATYFFPKPPSGLVLYELR